VGGGHAHVEVIRQFAMHPVNGIKLVLVSEEVETPYSGMIPGLIAGHYTEGECHISLGPLCIKAGVRLLQSKVFSIDVGNKIVHCESRPGLPYDLLSINTGSIPNLSSINGASFAIPIKPISCFLKQWYRAERLLLDQPRDFNVVVIGGGAGGVEASLCLSHRLSSLALSKEGQGINVSVSLVTDKPRLLENHTSAVMKKFLKVLQQKNIRVELDQSVTKITPTTVETGNGLILKSDIAVIATHASPPSWLLKTGLALDSAGFIKVDRRLRSVSHSYIFAAGDIAAHENVIPRNGVHAVRQGPVLAASLKRAVNNQTPARYVPQKKTLALITTGNKSAIASYGDFALQGEWLWKLKNWIDVRWMRKYNDLSMEGGGDDVSEDDMRCGGCGSKVSGVVLESVLTEVRGYEVDNLIIGLDSPDDSAVFSVPNGQVVVKTVDQFRSFIDDPYLFGLIATNHALNDIFAMGAKPSVAMALVTLPYAENQILKSELSQLLSGVNETLGKCKVALVGGHTGEGSEMSIGMSITGFANPEELLRKSGLKTGDAIILTRPLGSGALLAAHMRAKIEFKIISKMFATMVRTNEESSIILKNQNVSACTDVTGFGLLGHLGEMAESSKVHIELYAESIPMYEGVLDVFAQNIFSTLQTENKAYANKYLADYEDNATTDIMFDPQTSGGFIAGIDISKTEFTVNLLKEAGDYSATVIGYVTTGLPGKISIRHDN
jgi:selenide,water dikinase